MDDGTRTHDGRNHNPGLYQLSYVHQNVDLPVAPMMARLAGFEPATPGLEGRCSIQLSYRRSDSAPLHVIVTGMVGAAGFEPTTLCSQSRCATRLRHTPPESDCHTRAGDPARDAESYGSTSLPSTQIAAKNGRYRQIIGQLSPLISSAAKWCPAPRLPTKCRELTAHREFGRILSNP